MIIFKRLAYRNFLSTGDTFTEIPLNRSRSTLVVGQNGAGKSTMLDALSFALFGKAHRNINKAQLVNSINGKGMVVEVEFDIGPANYKLVRGVKPNKFEIWKDGTLVNQDSHNKEYQKVLEQNILKLNHKSFHQIVVLGSSSFIPFMQLPAQHRREVIEDLLDINVFSKMNGILKERVSILKEKDRANRVELDLINEKISTQQKYVKKLQELNKSQKIERLKEITQLEEGINTLMLTKGTVNEMSADPLKEQLNELSQKFRQLEKYDHQFGVKQKELNKEIKFYENNSTCPTCDQGIDEGLKQEKTESAAKKWDELEEGRHVASGKIKSLNEKLASVTEESNKLRDMSAELDKKQVKID